MAPEIIDSKQCHLWTDALHLRQLSREAMNRWDRGTYVRMCISTAWVALEFACQDALNTPKIGQRFKEDLDRAIADARIPGLDWSCGIWQEVRSLQEKRKDIHHRILQMADMFPDFQLAEEAVSIVRSASQEVYRLASRPEPAWLSLDQSHGWQRASPLKTHTTMTLAHAGAKADDPDTVHIYIVIDGEEKLTTLLPPGSDPKNEIANLIRNVVIPISAIRVYVRGELTLDYVVNMRGN